ncbi:MAG TPA: Holliday junction resolvase RuvX [Syntrophales bacterium]|jgi:putative Holliday junction resolvase|nr:Holliday junction resolvase RuvX [Syntrophales bacterium]HOX93276.1 Holliday junction resolvase RuvX [Syntrophales bacterium]HPI56250.1 Holliday junction resolvase RuvX [Syntrophales bacterium]HPN24437.1 Holliday junction resolvase RuvX [Syntrophales bacterium]HQM29067.1 Holliday junction resolvase RuvX [Syntrophales bacterium]
MRILGLDYGEKKVGLAVSDEMGITAQGLPTLVRKGLEKDLAALEKVIRQFAVEKIVIGYPLRLDGTEGIQCGKVNRFAGILEKRFALPVIKRDETLTTSQAEEILSEARASRKKRKAAVDKLAAMIILQGYLDQAKTKRTEGDV